MGVPITVIKGAESHGNTHKKDEIGKRREWYSENS